MNGPGELHPIEELAQRLDALGCIPEEVARVEAVHGQPLPWDLRVFLETMGRDVGGLFVGSDIGYPDLLEMRSYAHDLLVENECRHSLPDDALVFMMHQGYMMWFVRADDPRVFGWSEGQKEDKKHEFQVIAESLSEFLHNERNSTVGPKDRKESRRRSTQASRQRRFQPELCPNCSAPFGRWSMDLAFGPGELNPGRERMVGTCEQCGHTYWRWSDSPGAPLERLSESDERPKAPWWKRR